MRRTAVQAGRALHPAGIEIGTQVEPELGSDDHFPAERGKGFAHEFFVCERAVDLGCIEEGDAALDGCPEKCGHLLDVLGRAVRKAHPHAAKPERRNFRAAFSQFALLHFKLSYFLSEMPSLCNHADTSF